MPTNKTSGPKSPEDLYEEQSRKEGVSRKERQAVADFNEEERALEDDDGDVTQTATGKTIMRHGSKQHGQRSRRLKKAFAAGGLFGAVDAISRDLITFAAAALFPSGTAGPKSGISGNFSEKVNQRDSLQFKHEDEDYIYDKMQVSKPVYEKLMKESDIIARKLEELEKIKDVPAREQMVEVIEKMAEEFEMRLHPITKVYVHDYNRVLHEEKSGAMHSHALQPETQLMVCIFRAKAELSDLRGVKTKVADQYDQKPQEAQASGDHLKGAAPAPHLV